MSHDSSYSRHQSYNNRFCTSSSGGDNNTTTMTTKVHQLDSALEDVDVFEQSSNSGQLPHQQSDTQKRPDRSSQSQRMSTSQEQPRSCSEIRASSGLNSFEAVPNGQNDAPNQNAGDVPVPTAPGKPRRLSRQTSAGTKRQQFAASRSVSPGEGNPTSVDSATDDVFVELDVEAASPRPQRASFDSSLFPSKRRGEEILSTSSSTATILPNPYNRLNHRLHDAVWFCNCLYFAFFCCLPAIHYMEQSDVEFQRDNQKKASRLGMTSTVLFFVGVLLTLLFFSLIFFLAIYFTTR